jgi:hypothetical protein
MIYALWAFIGVDFLFALVVLFWLANEVHKLDVRIQRIELALEAASRPKDRQGPPDYSKMFL